MLAKKQNKDADQFAPNGLPDSFLKSNRLLLSGAALDKEHSKVWSTISQHSIAKLSKTYAESCFAPNPLPEELSQKLNEQIESSRDLLLEILFEPYEANKVLLEAVTET